jgi:hypothetical protein
MKSRNGIIVNAHNFSQMSNPSMTKYSTSVVWSGFARRHVSNLLNCIKGVHTLLLNDLTQQTREINFKV